MLQCPHKLWKYRSSSGSSGSSGSGGGVKRRLSDTTTTTTTTTTATSGGDSGSSTVFKSITGTVVVPAPSLLMIDFDEFILCTIPDKKIVNRISGLGGGGGSSRGSGGGGSKSGKSSSSSGSGSSGSGDGDPALYTQRSQMIQLHQAIKTSRASGECDVVWCNVCVV